MKNFKLMTLTMILLVMPLLSLAGDLPDGETIINKYIEETGGIKAWEGHTTMKAVGTLTMPAMGISGQVESWRQAPDRSRTIITSDAFGKIDEGFDGTVSWESSMMSGSKVKDGAELAISRRMSQFNPWSVWKDYYQSAVSKGIVTVEEVECYEVEMLPNEGEGEVEVSYFSVETGLLMKSSMVMVNEMGRITIDSYISDYRDVDGVLAPFLARQVLMGMQEMIMTFETQTFDVEIPEGTFNMPDDIKALMETK